MPKDDELEITIDPETGLIKTTTPAISAANHSNAEGFMKFLARLAGGATTITKRTKHAHTHASHSTEAKAEG